LEDKNDKGEHSRKVRERRIFENLSRLSETREGGNVGESLRRRETPRTSSA